MQGSMSVTPLIRQPNLQSKRNKLLMSQSERASVLEQPQPSARADTLEELQM